LFLPTYGISRSALKGLPSIDKMAKRLHKATWDEEKKKKKKNNKTQPQILPLTNKNLCSLAK